MKLSVGIVGLPNVGKSTLFKLLTKREVNIANYPFATIDPNVGVVAVSSERLDRLAEVGGAKEKIPAVLEFCDIAGLVRGAHKGEGLGNQFLSRIREVDMIAHVVRCFGAPDGGGGVIHIDGSVDPVRDFEVVLDELTLKDLEVVERRLEKVSRETRSGDKEMVKEKEMLEGLVGELGDGRCRASKERPTSGMSDVQRLGLLSRKAQVVVLNGSERDVGNELRRQIEERGLALVVLDLDGRPEVSGLIEKVYGVLDLISFFTLEGRKAQEWLIRKGTNLPEAVGQIHSDFQDKFIRAEVVGLEDFIKAQGWQRAKGRGLVRTEGRECEVGDGDVVLVRHG